MRCSSSTLHPHSATDKQWLNRPPPPRRLVAGCAEGYSISCRASPETVTRTAHTSRQTGEVLRPAVAHPGPRRRGASPAVLEGPASDEPAVDVPGLRGLGWV